MKKVIIISGPTGVGKTKLSIKLAKILNTEIISADSMQIFKKMDIGTAKVTSDEMQGIRHHLINILNADDYYSVQNFQKDAIKIINELHQKGKIPIVVGGTGLYIDSLMFEYNFNNIEPNFELRKRLEVEFEKNPQNLLDKLISIDKKYQKLTLKDRKKIIRALEVFEISGSTINYKRKKTTLPYEFYLYIITNEREILYENINIRVDEMLKKGLINEVESILETKFPLDSQSLKAIGYREVIDYLNGLYDYKTMVEKLKQNSRRYAKRQLTWFRRNEFSKWMNKSEFSDEEIIKNILGDIK